MKKFVELEFSNAPQSDSNVTRFHEICILPYATLGATRVGFDKAVDHWSIQLEKLEDPDDVTDRLKQHNGRYILQLVSSGGVPKFSNGDLYGGADETSFRGSFLGSSEEILDKPRVERTSDNMWPDNATAYGQQLLDAAAVAENRSAAAQKSTTTPLVKLGFKAKKPAPNFTGHIEIVRATGRRYLFWAGHGKPIRAWF